MHPPALSFEGKEGLPVNVELVVFRSDGSQRQIALKAGRYLIGRTDEATLRIPLPTVSRRHCEFVIDDSTVQVRDLGSSNGTFRNHERIQQSEFAAGDIIGIGDFLAVLRIDGVPMEVSRPEAPVEESPNMDDTPAHATAPTERTPLPQEDSVEDIDADLDATVAKKGMGSLLAGSDDGESSIFDFDFDFEDDDNPQL